MPTKAELYAQMAEKVTTQLTGSWQEWAGFLTTASRLYKYPFHEQYPHLLEIDETAQSRLEQMMPQLTKEAGATEELKASDPMKWVGLMNTCKAQAEEILMAELINS